jgi:hypothetical protein
MYKNGECKRYDYMYESEDIPHPFGLIMYLESKKDKLCFSDTIFPCANIKLYPILVLPKNAFGIIDAELYEFAEQCKILYEKESCQKCNEIYVKIKDSNDECGAKKYKNELKLHEATHQRIIASDIIDIIKDYDKYKEI